MTVSDDTHLNWRDMDDDARAKAYSPSSMLPNSDITPCLEAYANEGSASYAALPGVKTFRYGPGKSQTLDFVRPKGKASVPLLIFIHGGYWQALSKRDGFGPARATVSRGMAFASIDYTLAPEACLEEIVSECRNAVRLLVEMSDALGVDADRICLSGSSAGAHLAAMCCFGARAEHRPDALLLLSGIYELEPLIGTYINEPLELTVERARAQSPMSMGLVELPPTTLAVGSNETCEFKRQSRAFAAKLVDSGHEVATLEIAGRNHFDLVEDLLCDAFWSLPPLAHFLGKTI